MNDTVLAVLVLAVLMAAIIGVSLSSFGASAAAPSAAPTNCATTWRPPARVGDPARRRRVPGRRVPGTYAAEGTGCWGSPAAGWCSCLSPASWSSVPRVRVTGARVEDRRRDAGGAPPPPAGADAGRRQRDELPRRRPLRVAGCLGTRDAGRAGRRRLTLARRARRPDPHARRRVRTRGRAGPLPSAPPVRRAAAPAAPRGRRRPVSTQVRLYAVSPNSPSSSPCSSTASGTRMEPNELMSLRMRKVATKA